MSFYRESCGMGQKGFTLIEILITIAILGLVILPISGFFVQSSKLSAEAKEKLLCSQIAQRYMERYRINADKFTKSTAEIKEYQDTEYSDYHVVVEVAPFETSPSASKKFDYEYVKESDIQSNTDMKIVLNDDTTPSDKNTLFAEKNGETGLIFSMDAGTKDVFLDITINRVGKNVIFNGWRGDKTGPSLLVDKSKEYTLYRSIFDATRNAEYIQILMNTNQNLTLQLINQRTETENTDCIVYVVHPKGKTGRVIGISTLGRNDIIDNLHDRTLTEGLPENGLYKVKVSVFKGKDRSGKKIYELNSYLR